jgi:hypothetical protein
MGYVCNVPKPKKKSQNGMCSCSISAMAELFDKVPLDSDINIYSPSPRPSKDTCNSSSEHQRNGLGPYLWANQFLYRRRHSISTCLPAYCVFRASTRKAVEYSSAERQVSLGAYNAFCKTRPPSSFERQWRKRCYFTKTYVATVRRELGVLARRKCNMYSRLSHNA